MKYSCSYCDYNTNDRCNWIKHTNTKKHLTNEQKEIKRKSMSTDVNQMSTKLSTDMSTASTDMSTTSTKKPRNTTKSITIDISSDSSSDSNQERINKYNCDSCDSKFTTRQALSRHRKYRCGGAKDELDKDKKIIELTNELKKQSVSISELKEQNRSLQYIAKTAISTTKTSVNALTFVTTTYFNAPILAPMPDYLPIKDYCGDLPVGKVIADLYDDGNLVKYLGKILIQYYKKNDPEEQSFWNSDCSRLTYLIRTIVGEKPEWIGDKRGVQLKEHIIKPLLEFIEKEVNELVYNSKYKKTVETLNSCSRLMLDIKNSVISDELLRYLAPHFAFPKMYNLAIQN
jgi:hypothetical protein